MLRRELGPLHQYQAAVLRNPFIHFVFWGGVAVGKSYTGAHFAIDMILTHPECTGFIGANTHDQLSQATLREFFYWLNDYGFQYTVDKIPPVSWGKPREFKDYKNIITVRNPWSGKVTSVITRVLSNPDPLRGIELTWYWIDETRDTEEYAFDMILGRLRESSTIRGVITTTTNGEDWLYQRVLRNRGKGITYGSMHVQTMEALKCGTISQAYYDQLLASYTELMVQQELMAAHVNVRGGRAYYAAGDHNRMTRAPWGDLHPTNERPLIVGCDFNYSPSPCVWMIGQTGPDGFEDQIHWFGELVGNEASSPEMTMQLISQYPNFFYRIFGDYSGNIGTTSNAGETDYNQIGHTLTDNNCQYSVDCDQANPHVKDRVENVNGLLKNALGEVRCTYDSQRCPMLDSDFKIVGWKQSTLRGRGRLDDNGDLQRTHASDGMGYALWKLFPPGRRGVVGYHVPNVTMQRISTVV